MLYPTLAIIAVVLAALVTVLKVVAPLTKNKIDDAALTDVERVEAAVVALKNLLAPATPPALPPGPPPAVVAKRPGRQAL